MKKTYIEPKNTVVKLNVVKMISTSAEDPKVSKSTAQTRDEGGTHYLDMMESRETVSVPDAWDEW